jgi:hypothetical protein
MGQQEKVCYIRVRPTLSIGRRQMRRGETKPTGSKRSARAPTGIAKSKTRPRGKTSAPTLAEQLAAKTRELDEALQQQAATSEVLQIISSSPGDLESVFDTILKNATRICEAQFGNLHLFDGEAYRNVAFHNTPPEFVSQYAGKTFVSFPGGPGDRLKRTKQPVHVADLRPSRLIKHDLQ